MYSNKRPFDKSIIEYQSRMFKKSIESLADFSDGWEDNWRLLADVANMAETYVTHNKGVWRVSSNKTVELSDDDGLIEHAVNLLAIKGSSAKNGDMSGFDENDMELLNDLIDCYCEILGIVSASEANKCRNITATRVKRILAGDYLETDIFI